MWQKINDASEDKEIEDGEMHHNNDNNDNVLADRYKVTGVNKEEHNDDLTWVQDAQNNIDK